MTAPALEAYQRCGRDKCPHCAAGNPPAPAEANINNLDGLYELDDDVRQTLPPKFHQPYFMDLCSPKLWACTACWGDATVTQWPCEVAQAHGADVARAMGVGYSR